MRLLCLLCCKCQYVHFVSTLTLRSPWWHCLKPAKRAHSVLLCLTLSALCNFSLWIHFDLYRLCFYWLVQLVPPAVLIFPIQTTWQSIYKAAVKFHHHHIPGDQVIDLEGGDDEVWLLFCKWTVQSEFPDWTHDLKMINYIDFIRFVKYLYCSILWLIIRFALLPLAY